jgi:hypothetical protein
VIEFNRVNRSIETHRGFSISLSLSNIELVKYRVGEIIDVAVDSAYDEQDPAVALCTYDQYLVIYEQDGNIYGQRLTNTGALLGGAFVIFART